MKNITEQQYDPYEEYLESKRDYESLYGKETKSYEDCIHDEITSLEYADEFEEMRISEFEYEESKKAN